MNLSFLNNIFFLNIYEYIHRLVKLMNNISLLIFSQMFCLLISFFSSSSFRVYFAFFILNSVREMKMKFFKYMNLSSYYSFIDIFYMDYAECCGCLKREKTRRTTATEFMKFFGCKCYRFV